jgi:hypothetical protein
VGDWYGSVGCGDRCFGAGCCVGDVQGRMGDGDACVGDVDGRVVDGNGCAGDGWARG